MHAQRVEPPSKCLLLSEGRALLELVAFFGAIPWLRTLPSGDGHPVLVFPGLAASDDSTRPLRAFLRDRGYESQGWNLGHNVGLRPGLSERKLQRLHDIRKRSGRKVSLIGWSLGGVFARELAKQAPDDVRLVITLGSPFRGDPKASNAWRLYEALAGHKVDHVRARLHPEVPPPVPTTAIFSRTDGIVAWQCCVEDPGRFSESIEVEGSHCGLGHHPAALYAIADRLAQPEGTWAPFDRSGVRSLLFPDPWRDLPRAA